MLDYVREGIGEIEILPGKKMADNVIPIVNHRLRHVMHPRYRPHPWIQRVLNPLTYMLLSQ